MAKDDMAVAYSCRIHEDRILKLEDGHREVSSSLATITERVDAGFKVVSEKIDLCLAPVNEKLLTTSISLEAVRQESAICSDKVSLLHDEAAKKSQRSLTVRNTVIAIGLTLLGAMASDLWKLIRG